MIKALRQPSIFRLWLGQAFSSVGDEIYRVGLTWLAVGLMGTNVGYLTAGQTASLMVLSFIGGKWADHWHPFKTLIAVDCIRAILVLVPVVIYFFIPVPLWVLWVVALTLAGLSAFFDPAVQTVIPVLAKDFETLQSTNGLMSTTIRMARMVGPAIVGLLSAFVPMIHFFSLDALTFLVSAASVKSLKKELTVAEAEVKGTPAVGIYHSLVSGFHLLKKKPGMGYIIFSKAVTAGTWNLALILGFALLIHQVTSGDAQSFGLVMASYGVGNFAGALYFGNRVRTRSEFLMFTGYLWLGMGFVLIGLAPSVPWIMLAAAAGGFGGPMNDLGFIDLIQKHYSFHEITKIFRLRMATESAATLVFTVISPGLFQLLSVRTVIMACGVTWILSGLVGLFVKDEKPL